MIDKAFLEITNRCNLSCSFCHGTSRAPWDLGRDEFKTIAEKLTGRVRYLYFHLMGEPLVHPDLCLFICEAADMGFRPMLTTNGTLLRLRGNELLGTPLFKVSISMHAPEANGAFATEGYISSCLDYASAAARNGTIAVLRLWNDGGADSGNGLILNALREAFPGEWTPNRSGFRLSEKVFLERGRKFSWPDMDAHETDGRFFCYGLRDQIGILSDGTVVPCCLDADGRIALGNILEQSLDEILQSPRASAVYDGFTNHTAAEPLCRRCGYAAETMRYRSSRGSV